ncbi:hypothetical protein U0070_009861 [Myodes glareolus]|uniref:Chemokine interleukin-8-like domain-containing protein n=1 Tax=Myodes glareolus TaxID=447135 RepID=A0AAW0HWX7_MYOGA
MRLLAAALLLLLLALCASRVDGSKCKCSRKGPKIRYSDVKKLEMKPKYPHCEEKMVISEVLCLHLGLWRKSFLLKLATQGNSSIVGVEEIWALSLQEGRELGHRGAGALAKRSPEKEGFIMLAPDETAATSQSSIKLGYQTNKALAPGSATAQPRNNCGGITTKSMSRYRGQEHCLHPKLQSTKRFIKWYNAWNEKRRVYEE